MQVDSREQLVTGIMDLLSPALSGLVSTANGSLRASWPDVELVQMIDTAPGQLPALVVVDLRADKPLAKQPAQMGEKKVTLPIANGQITTTQLKPVMQRQAQLCLIIVGAGEDGPTLVGQCRVAIAGALGTTAVVPVPDWSDGASPVYTLGLTALLTYAGGAPNPAGVARRFYRYDLDYTALYTEYQARPVTISQKVILDETFAGQETIVTIPSS